MSQIRFTDPPPPPEGQEWCLMCLMLAKARVIAAHPDLPKFAQDGKDGVHWVPWDTGIRLMPALCRGVTDLPQLGVVPVCWTHMAGINVQRASPLAIGDGAQIPPGLLRGQG